MKSVKQSSVERLIDKHIPLSIFCHEMSKIGVYVVKPEENVSAVFFSDERRFFPKINEDDIVVGGFFG